MPFSLIGLYRYIFISASSTFWLQLPSFKWDNWKVKTGPRIPEYGQEKQGQDKILTTAGFTYVWFMWWPVWFLTLMLISVLLIKKMKRSSHSLEKSLNFRGSFEKSLNSIFPWKILKFLCKSLKSPWIFFSFKCSGLKSVFWCFWLSRTEYKS